MAQAIACDLCGQESAVMLETRVETGEVIAVGAACLVPFYTGALMSVAASLDPEVAAEYGDAIRDLFNLPIWRLIDPPPSPPAESPASPAVPGIEDASVNGEGITVTADPSPPARKGRARTTT